MKKAAHLLYLGLEKEYKQAKLKAAQKLRMSFSPENLEAAMEIDTIAEENEGSTRQEHSIQMRREASELMQVLKVYKPRFTNRCMMLMSF